jgi:DNA-directed RNA polymerase specialized sigma24 family protein
VTYAELDTESKDLIDEALTSRQAEVIKLRLNETPWRLISDTLDIDVSTAKGHYAAALRRLRRAMEEKARMAA